MPFVAERESAAIEPDLETVAEADERVAREPFATLDALEEESGLERGELRERGNRSIQVAGDVERWFQKKAPS